MQKSKLALISLILSTLYVTYLIYYVSSTGSKASSGDSAAQVGTTIGIAIILPHLICTGIALLMNILGYFLNVRGLVLTAAILYTVAIVLMPVYAPFVLVQTILCYIAFVKMKKIKYTKDEVK